MSQDEIKTGIRIVIIPGSVRPGNYTAMAVELVADEIKKHAEIALDHIDLAELNLQPPGAGSASAELESFVETVSGATGVILATPEYHGSFSSVTKLAIENLGFPSVLSGKPVALLGVAAGAIGAIKSLEQLRGVCSHVGAIVLPPPPGWPNAIGLLEKRRMGLGNMNPSAKRFCRRTIRSLPADCSVRARSIPA